jgi:hypothetical protein
MNKLTKRQKKWIAILIVTLALGALLIFSTVKFFEREGGISFGGIIRAETFYIIVIFLILIPLSSPSTIKESTTASQTISTFSLA